MNDIVSIMQPYSIYIILAMAILLMILMIYIIVINRKIKILSKKYERFMKGSSGDNVEDILSEWVDKLKMLEVDKNQLKHDLSKLRQNQELCIQKVNVTRYNPFENMGGDFCFVLTLLDAYNNGIILNGLHSREGSYIYAKPVEEGKSKYKLSEEEMESLSKAI
ncbi:DUF4446 family protein [Vallitalea okinawensis]|uniref:DUF4446 family protein n=1 Tax=Vallitalea okinawensis TaxID=2078660 RepID=UPI001FA84C18|nr:DUF4446 family protein [Vallitalea okinawensis]